MLAGCSADAPEEQDKPGPSKLKGWADRPEVLWLRDLVSWSEAFDRALLELDEVPDDPDELERKARPVSDCAKRLRRQVGSAPTERLARTLDLLEKACAHYGRAADLLVQAARGGGGEQQAVLRASQGRRLFERVYVMLPPGGTQALPVMEAKSSESKIDALYGRVVGEIADDRNEVRCWAEADWPRLIGEENVVLGGSITKDVSGFTRIGTGRINLSPPACRELDRLAYDREQPESSDAKLRVALGVATLAHEAQHAKGVIEEDEAECYGMQSLRAAAVSLGADAGYANELAEAYWSSYPEHPPEYRSDECHDGGTLDLHPETNRWP